MRRFRWPYLCVAVVAVCLSGPVNLSGQPGGGQGPPAPPPKWTLVLPPDGLEVTETSNVAGSGAASDLNHAYLFVVTYDGGAKSAAGQSSGAYNWTITVDPPAGTGNKWPIGETHPNGYAKLIVDAEQVDSHGLHFKKP